MTREEEVDPEFMEVWDEEKEVRTESLDELEAFLLSELEKDKFFSINLGLT